MVIYFENLKKNKITLNNLLNFGERDKPSNEDIENIKSILANINNIDKTDIQKIINQRNPIILDFLLSRGVNNPKKFENIDFSPIIGKDSNPIFFDRNTSLKYRIYNNIHNILKKNKQLDNLHTLSRINEDFANFLIETKKYPQQHLSHLLNRDISKDLMHTISISGMLNDDHIDQMLNHHQKHVQEAAINYLINQNKINNPEIQNKIRKIENINLLNTLLNIPNYVPSENILLEGIKHQSPEIQEKSINKIIRAKTEYPNEYSSDKLINSIIDTQSPKNIIHFLSSADSDILIAKSNIKLNNEQQNKILDILKKTPSTLIPNKAFGLTINWSPSNTIKLLKILQEKKPSIVNNFSHNYIDQPHFSGDDLEYIYNNIKNTLNVNKPKLYSMLINHKNVNANLINKIIDDISADYSSKKINFKNYLELRNDIYTKKPKLNILTNKLPINIKSLSDQEFKSLINSSLTHFKQSIGPNIINQIIDRIGKNPDQAQRDQDYYNFLIYNSLQIPKESVDKIIYSVHPDQLPKISLLLANSGKINNKHYQYIKQFPFAKDLFISFSIPIHPATEKLTDLKEKIRLSGGKINKKELPNKGAAIPSQLFDGKGDLTEESINKYIESLPKTEYNITWDKWDGDQRHRAAPQRVLQLNITEDQINQLKKENLYDDYKFFKDMMYQDSHPVHKKTLGWARIDDSQPGHWHIDEIQSDFGQNIPQILNLREKKGEITSEEKEKKLNSYKKIMKIICGPFKNINHAIFHAVHNVGREKGINSLSMDELTDQAKQSGMTLSVNIDANQAYEAISQSRPHRFDYAYKAAYHWGKQNGLIDEAGNISPKEDFINKWKQQHGHIGIVELPVPLPVHMQFTYDQLPKEYGYISEKKEKFFPKKDYDEQYLQYKKLIKSITILLKNIEKYGYKL